MSEEILINGKKITELSDMFFEYCELKKETERLQEENEELKKYQYTQEYLQSEIEKRQKALKEIRENIQNWINSPWSCFNCRNNMDERLTEMKSKINEVLNEQK